MPRILATLIAGALAVAAAAPPASADRSAGGTRFEIAKDRRREDRILIAALGGGALVVGGVGLLLHLDSRAKADSISNGGGANQGRVYTPAVDDTRRAALRSRNLTIATYAVAGGLLVATFVVYLATDPGTEVIELDDAPMAALAALRVEPLPGGAVVGGGWSF